MESTLLAKVFETSDGVKEIFQRARTETEAGGLTPETELALTQVCREQEFVVTELANWYLYTDGQQKGLEAQYKPLREKMDDDIDALEEKKNFIKWALAQVLPPEKGARIANEQIDVKYTPSVSVIVDDPEGLPLEFVDIISSPKKKEIKAAIESGATVPSARLSENLNIQIKLGGVRAIKNAGKQKKEAAHEQ